MKFKSLKTCDTFAVVVANNCGYSTCICMWIIVLAIGWNESRFTIDLLPTVCGTRYR
jgi:hypothetical protein